jgi:hypothetical protein
LVVKILPPVVRNSRRDTKYLAASGLASHNENNVAWEKVVLGRVFSSIFLYSGRSKAKSTIILEVSDANDNRAA